MLLRFALGSLAIVLLGAAVVTTALRLEINETVQAFVRETIPIRGVQNVLDDVQAGKPQTILVLGSDKRFNEKAGPGAARSDTMMLIRLDPEKNATAVMSIPRDLKATIPGHGVDKINAAYSIGGPKLAVTTVRSLLNIPINHVVNVNFGGFSRAVKRLGCFYIDVDRRYFNDNNPPAGGGGDRYATIDIEPGYQRLCGLDSLDYVRFRHLDDDFVRAARQQSYLEQAKSQVGVGRLFSDREELLRIFGRYTQTDINSEGAILRLLRLTYEATKSPIREVRFPAGIENDTGGSYVTITDDNLQKTVHQFLEVRGSSGAGARKPTTTTPKTSGTSSSSSKKKKKASKRIQRLCRARARARGGQDAGRGLRCDDVDEGGRTTGLLPRRPHRCRLRKPVLQPEALHDQGPRGLRVQGVPDRRLRGGERPVLGRAGHELALAADPRRPGRHDQDARPGLPRVLRRHAAAPHRLADRPRGLLGVQHALAHADESADARHREVADPRRNVVPG